MNSPHEVGLVELGAVGDHFAGWFGPLTINRFQKGSPPDLATPKLSGFDFWWNNPLVEGSSRKSFSRWNLINIMANQDGGAHVDKVGLDADYQDLELDYLGVQIERNASPADRMDTTYSPPKVENNAAYASVRQIAFELTTSLAWKTLLKEKPGILVSADPFSELQLEPPPHRVLNPVTPTAITATETLPEPAP